VWIRPGFGFRLEAELAQTNEDAGKIMDNLHLDMCSNLHGSVAVSGLTVPTPWFGFALLYCTKEFRQRGFRLNEKPWRFLKATGYFKAIESSERLAEKRSVYSRTTSLACVSVRSPRKTG
jgi:hypothetical protein